MKNVIVDMLKRAGIEVNGPNPWDIQILDDRLYDRILRDHSLGLGEGYMDGWWECQRIDEMSARMARASLDTSFAMTYKEIANLLLHRIFNFQTKNLSNQVAVQHYDLGNSFYEKMLGPTMNYSCGYWEKASTLDEAQKDKMELICRKLQLRAGERLLDIGCGWGGLARYAAENYGVEVVGTTISKEQQRYAEERCKGYPVRILLSDYRDLATEKYDKIVSVGMFEHVGYKNYRHFMDIVSECLDPNGIFLLHTIGGNASYHYGDEWISKYIFPNGMLPSVAQIGEAIDGLLVMEDWHNFGVYYDKTLMAWNRNFLAHWPEFVGEYGERFRRMWHYYLMLCAGYFRARKIQLWQVVLSKNGLTNGFSRPTFGTLNSNIRAVDVPILPR